MEGKPIEKIQIQQLVSCRMTHPRALRTLEKCQACPDYGGIQELSPEQNGTPAQHQIVCNLPSGVLVVNLLVEG